MATLTLKKKTETSNNLWKFAIMRKPEKSKRMFFTAFHDTFQSAEIERNRLKTITNNSTFLIVFVVEEG
jgi:hypothetical protein